MTLRFATARRCLVPAFFAVVLALTGCTESVILPSAVPAVGARESVIIGPEGGRIDIDDLSVTFPAGAVATPTAITVTVEAPSTSGRLRAFSPVLRFEPANLTLAVPAEIRLPFRGDAALANAFLANAAGEAFAARATRVEGDVAVFETTSMRSSFVGSACEGAECACEPVSTLDLLVVVDNSNSMAEEQAMLRAELPGLFRALATGDLDGDGTQDLASFESVRVGVVTTDLGAGPGIVPTCTGPATDDAVLRTNTDDPTLMGCPAGGFASPFAAYDGATPAALPDFVQHVACTSAAGVGGCGFERPLEAARFALSPTAPTSWTAPGYASPMLADGRSPNGDGANAGFLRDGSLLAVLFVTDEDDCSATETSLYDIEDARFASIPNLNMRCIGFRDTALFDVPTLVESLTGLRPQPQDLVVAAIAGVPTDLATDDLDAVLADPRMTPVDDGSGMNIETACTSPGRGVAYPANRLVQALRGVEQAGGRAVLQSICNESFQTATESLAEALAERAGGDC
jgi:hypothetical protein